MRRILRHRGCYMKPALAHVLLDFRPVLLRDSEVDIDRIRLVDDHHRRICRLDEIPRFRHQCAGAPVDRRMDGGIAQLQLRCRQRVLVHGQNGTDVFDRRAVCVQRFLQRTGLRARLLGTLRCDQTTLLKRRIPLRICLPDGGPRLGSGLRVERPPTGHGAGQDL